MKARDAISLVNKNAGGTKDLPSVSGGMHLLDVLPMLFESGERRLRVTDDNDSQIGLIDSDSMLEALGRQIAPRYDCSLIELVCAPHDYSASMIARAIEDTDAHLVDLFTVPSDDGSLHVTLRIRCEDPTSAVHSLERYGYTVTDSFGHGNIEASASLERLLALRALINV